MKTLNEWLTHSKDDFQDGLNICLLIRNIYEFNYIIENNQSL